MKDLIWTAAVIIVTVLFSAPRLLFTISTHLTLMLKYTNFEDLRFIISLPGVTQNSLVFVSRFLPHVILWTFLLAKFAFGINVHLGFCKAICLLLEELEIHIN